jgi:hypothetical protein
MAGRPSEVEHIKKTFLNEVAVARHLVDTIRNIPQKVRPSKIVKVSLHPKFTQQVIALAFMGVVAAWEEFLERSLVRYLAGAQTASGYSPTPKIGVANTIQHAYEILSQNANYDSTQKYLKASDPKWILSMADFFFSSHSYSCLREKNDLIKHASSIRNRVAHGSEKSRTDFRATAIHFLHPVNNKLPKSFGPGRLLAEPIQRHLGAQDEQAGRSHIAGYFRMYEALANKIVP